MKIWFYRYVSTIFLGFLDNKALIFNGFLTAEICRVIFGIFSDTFNVKCELNIQIKIDWSVPIGSNNESQVVMTIVNGY